MTPSAEMMLELANRCEDRATFNTAVDPYGLLKEAAAALRAASITRASPPADGRGLAEALDRISLPVDGWKLEARKFGDGIEIAIVTDDAIPATHYVRLGSIGSAALRDYLAHALTTRSYDSTGAGEKEGK